jgi:hypothetical protein
MRSVIQLIGRRGPVAMSIAAILLLVFALATGFERGAKDEGVVAHTWQLLIGLQLPLIAAFLATADWRRPIEIAKVLAVQVAALALAMAPVAMLRL